MQEIELKLGLDSVQERRLRRSDAVKRLSQGSATTQSLWSVYYDTQDQALRAHGIALRLRRVGGAWIQTLKRAPQAMQIGLSSLLEIEYPVARQEIDLTRIPDHDLREQIIGLSRAGLVPVAETRFRRTKRILSLPDGSATAEFAIDHGTLGLGKIVQPFVEAEFELKQGRPAGLYDLAAQVMPCGPVRFSSRSKSERARGIAMHDLHEPLRKARPVDLAQARTVEEAAILILSEGLAHAAPNIALVIDTDDINGPHQMRVGLRRLRSALSAFRPALGREKLATIGCRAQNMATAAGRIRDLDVLATDILAKALQADPTEPGYHKLANAVQARLEGVRSEVRKNLALPEHAMFPLHFAQFLAQRAWVDGTDHAQTARLAQPIVPFASKVLNKRWKVVSAWGDRIAVLNIDERHELRKEIKKLRYLIDAFQSVFDSAEVLTFMKQVKRLQKAFGALNDSAMAETMLMAPDAPGLNDPVAQRAAGKIIGRLQARSDALWPAAIDDWDDLVGLGTFWRR